jgi:hypothetical protein
VLFANASAPENSSGRISCDVIDWIDLARNMEQWLAVVSAGMKFRVANNAGDRLTNQATMNV